MRAISDTAAPAVSVEGLEVEFRRNGRWTHVLNGVDLTIQPGEIVGLVGESGSGKSVTAYSLMRLLPDDVSRMSSRKLDVVDCDLRAATSREVQALRGGVVSFVFQEPMTALNPILRIGRQMTDVIERHTPLSRAKARDRAIELLTDMLIEDPKRVLESYPHQLSGGMRQRVLLGMAFSCHPRLLIADEPTTALDVTVQALILDLIRRKADETGAAVLFVTHDLAVVSEICDRVYVMLAGSVVEHGSVEQVLHTPKHPYTRALLAARPEKHIPRSPLGVVGETSTHVRIAGSCPFLGRCPEQGEPCTRAPDLEPTDHPGQFVACWRSRVPE